MLVFNKGVAHQRRTLLFTTLLLLTWIVPGPLNNTTAQADETDKAWREFQYALGEPASIGAGADHPLADALWRPIPAVAHDEINEQKFRLGFQLFHEGRLSSADSVACISCHAGPQGGVDGLRFSRGVNRTLGHFNSLPVFNAAFHFRQFWDGRALTMHDQALEPITNEVEMANTLEAVQAMLAEDPHYSARFDALYADGVTLNNMADALVHFQRINFTRTDSAFMRHLQGADDQLSEQAVRGMQRFQDVGCGSCHNGISLGGNSYQKLGALIPYYGDQRVAGTHDEGVYRRTGRPQDLHVFKVPSLHTAAATAPYFHDGSVATLEAAIAAMAEHQLATMLSDEDTADIAAFLRALLPNTAPLAVDISLDPAIAVENDESRRPIESRSAEHLDAYIAAIIELDQIFANLIVEAQRINAGHVAHFDFLQYQHLELIRHARALRFAPADIDSSTQQLLLAAAEKLLAEVDNLEWVIADMLRAHVIIEALDIVDEGTQRAPGLPSSTKKRHFYQEASDESRDRLRHSDVPGLSSALRHLSNGLNDR